MSTNKKTESTINTFKDLVKEIKDTEAFEIEVVRDLISEQIFKMMTVEKISKADLARELKTSPPYITKLLQGNGNFTIETLIKIARALGYKFRPIFIPANQAWKPVVEYVESAKFNAPEQRIITKRNFKTCEKVAGVDFDDSSINTDITNDDSANIAN